MLQSLPNGLADDKRALVSFFTITYIHLFQEELVNTGSELRIEFT